MIVNLLSFVRSLPNLHKVHGTESHIWACPYGPSTVRCHGEIRDYGSFVERLSLLDDSWAVVQSRDNKTNVYTWARREHFFLADKLQCMKLSRYISWRLKERDGKAPCSSVVKRLVSEIAGEAIYTVHVEPVTVKRYCEFDDIGLESCMTRETGYYDGDDHPIRVFENTDINLAMCLDSEGEIVARALVYQGKYPRVYINNRTSHDCVIASLKQAGYTYNSYALDGAKVHAIPSGNGWLMPYIDGNADCAVLVGEFFILSSSGEYICNDTSGVIAGGGERCVDCGNGIDVDYEGTYIEGNGPVCDSCLDSSYVLVTYDRYGGGEYAREGGDYYSTGDGQYCFDTIETASHYDYYLCSETNELYPLDELKCIVDGDFIHIDFTSTKLGDSRYVVTHDTNEAIHSEDIPTEMYYDPSDNTISTTSDRNYALPLSAYRFDYANDMVVDHNNTEYSVIVGAGLIAIARRLGLEYTGQQCIEGLSDEVAA